MKIMKKLFIFPVIEILYHYAATYRTGKPITEKEKANKLRVLNNKINFEIKNKIFKLVNN